MLRGPVHRSRPAQQWALTVREWRRSGMKASAFCRARGVTLKTFEWWRWALLSGRASAAAVRLVTDQSSPAPLGGAPTAQKAPTFVEVLPRSPRASREVAQ